MDLDVDDNLNGGNQIKPCTSCLAPNDIAATFCISCAMPLGDFDSFYPIRRIAVEGQLWQRAVTNRPKFIVLLGVWIIFLPALLICALAALGQIAAGGGTSGLVMFWILTLLAFGSAVILFRVTKNYFWHQKPSEKVE